MDDSSDREIRRPYTDQEGKSIMYTAYSPMKRLTLHFIIVSFFISYTSYVWAPCSFQNNPDLSLAMPCDVAAVWIGQILHPFVYNMSCEQNFGEQILNHDHTFVDRSQAGSSEHWGKCIQKGLVDEWFSSV